MQPRSQGHLTFELQLIVTRNEMPSYPGNEVGSSEFGQIVNITMALYHLAKGKVKMSDIKLVRLA